MNNGNLLNSLLGITSANPAVTKASAAKARAESTEKFQQALEQVRPEVAARKPVARKESPPAEPSSAARPTPKSATQRNSSQETHRADAPAKARDDTQDVASRAPEKSEASVRDAGADEPVKDNQNEEQPTEPQNQTLQGDAQHGEDREQSDGEATIAIAVESLLMIDPALSVESGADGASESSESLLNTANAQPLALGELINADDTDLSLTSNEGAVVDPSLLAAQSPLVSVAEVAITSDLSADTPGDSQSALLATNQIVLGQVASGIATTGSVLDAPSAAMQAASVAPGVTLTDELTVDSSDAEVDMSAGTGTDAEENPDFLLLNSKAAQNKLAETMLTTATLDKAAPAADLAKPAAISAAVETLTRLTEAQSPAARAFVVQTGVPVTVGTPQWSQAVGDKVLWLAAQNVSSAEIRLDPPELGPMQVKVSVNQDQASITFTSPHPAVREALDQQLNRLREMFSEQGLNLVNVDVSDKSFAQREREQEESAKNQGNTDMEEDELMPVGVTQAISMRLVDHYA